MKIHLLPKLPLNGLMARSSKANPSKYLLPPGELSSHKGEEAAEEEEAEEEEAEVVLEDAEVEDLALT